jgi:hypothetical protein
MTPEIHNLRKMYASGDTPHYNRHPACGKTLERVPQNSSGFRINISADSMKKYHPEKAVFRR